MQVYKAAKYIRLSYTDDKSNESNSVGNQRKLIEDFVSRHPEIELVSEKVDDGYSGVIFDRPAFKEMMDDIMERSTVSSSKTFPVLAVSILRLAAICAVSFRPMA